VSAAPDSPTSASTNVFTALPPSSDSVTQAGGARRRPALDALEVDQKIV